MRARRSGTGGTAVEAAMGMGMDDEEEEEDGRRKGNRIK
jgi:hypothetical protein